MNTVIHHAAETVQLGNLLGVTTVAFTLFFAAWALWSWAPSNRARLDRYARLPLDDGDSNG